MSTVWIELTDFPDKSRTIIQPLMIDKDSFVAICTNHEIRRYNTITNKWSKRMKFVTEKGALIPVAAYNKHANKIYIITHKDKFVIFSLDKIESKTIEHSA